MYTYVNNENIAVFRTAIDVHIARHAG